jgi:hypothetical protein
LDTVQTKGVEIEGAALNVCKYGASTRPLGRDVVVMAGGILMVNARVPGVEFALSAARMVKVNVPDIEGVPLITPLFTSKFKPGGNAPMRIDQVNGGVPPVAASAGAA